MQPAVRWTLLLLLVGLKAQGKWDLSKVGLLEAEDLIRDAFGVVWFGKVSLAN